MDQYVFALTSNLESADQQPLETTNIRLDPNEKLIRLDRITGLDDKGEKMRVYILLDDSM